MKIVYGFAVPLIAAIIGTGLPPEMAAENRDSPTVFFVFPEIGAEDWFRQVMVAEGRGPGAAVKRKHHIVFQAPNPYHIRGCTGSLDRIASYRSQPCFWVPRIPPRTRLP
jgi:hypothetical protein